MQQFQCPAFYWQTSTEDQCYCPCHRNANFQDMNGGGPSETPFSSNGFAKSEYDKRDYRAVTLSNKLKVLLISDPDTDKAAGALSVLAGSMHDPENIPGMAHFCEHMLFLGTEKYPEENSFGKFLAANGGDYNAFTQRDSTTYYFDVVPTALGPALDRFAQLFISPLFTESAQEREVQAIASEHENNAGNDSERRGLVDNLLCRKGHPYRKFDCGNVKTLLEYPQQQGLNVVEELRKFFREHYSANLMSVAIIGRETCDEMQALVEESLGRIQNSERETPHWPDSPYGPDELMTRVDLVPLMENFSALLIFPVPDVLEHYKSGAINYLEYLLSQEGPGSLPFLLKRNHWSTTGLRMAYERPGKGFAFFAIEISLTEHGFESMEEVVKTFFQYIEMMRTMSGQKWIWDEIKVMNDIDFKFSEKEDAIKTVGILAVAQHNFPPNEVLLAKHSVISEYKPELIDELLAMLIPSNMRIITMAKSNAQIADTEDEWHGARFRYSKIPPSLIKKWRAPGMNYELSLPSPNPLLPSSLCIKPRENFGEDIPSLIEENEISRVWFLQDRQYQVPQASMIVAIISAVPMRDPNSFNMTELLVRVVNDILGAEIGSQAAGASLNYTIEASMTGLSVLVEGYDSKCGVLFEHALKTLLQASSGFWDRLEDLKTDYARELENERDDEPFALALSYVHEMLRKATWSNEKLRESLQDENPSASDVSLLAKQLLANVKIEWLFVGNLTEQEARDTYRNAFQCFGSCRPLSEPEMAAIRMGKREAVLPPAIVHIYRAKHRSHWNSAALLLIQCGPGGPRETVLLELIESMMSEPAYDILRTQEQLGYVVLTHARKSKGTLSLIVLVQGEKNPAYLDERIENFLLQFNAFMESMDRATFENYRSSFMFRKREKPPTLSSFALEVFDEIFREEYNFYRRCSELEALQSITLDDLVQFYMEWISPRAFKRKKLSIQVSASSNEGTTNSVNKSPAAPSTGEPKSSPAGGMHDPVNSENFAANRQLKIKYSIIRNPARQHLNHSLRNRTKPHLKSSNHKYDDRFSFSTSNDAKHGNHLKDESKRQTIWPHTPRPQLTSFGPEPSRGGSVDSNNQSPQPNVIINPHHRMSTDTPTSRRNTLLLERHKSHHVKMNALGTNFSSGRDSGSNPGTRRLSTTRSDMMSLAIIQAASNMLQVQNDLKMGPNQEGRSIESQLSGIDNLDSGANQHPNFPAQPISQSPQAEQEVLPNESKPEDKGAGSSRTSADPNCQYRRRKVMLPVRKLRKKPSLTSVRFSFNLQPKRRLVNRSCQDLLLRARYRFLQMKPSSQTTSSSGIANQGSNEPPKSMIQLWIDNLVKAAVKMAVGDRNLHQSKEAGPSILRDWVDNMVEQEIDRAGHDLNEADKDNVRVQVYDAVRNSIESLPQSKSSSKGSKKKKKGKKNKRGTPSGSPSPSSSKTGKRKHGKVKKGPKSSTKQTSSPSSASSDESDTPKSGKPRKKKRIMKSRTPSPNVSTTPKEPADESGQQPTFTKNPKHTTKKIPFQRRSKNPAKSSDDSDYPSSTSESSVGKEDDIVSSEPRSGEMLEDSPNSTSLHNGGRGNQGEQTGGSSTSLQTFDLDELEAERMRFDVIPTVLPMTAVSAENGAPLLTDLSPIHPAAATKEPKKGPAFTSTPAKGERGAAVTSSRAPQPSSTRSRNGSFKATHKPEPHNAQNQTKLDSTPSMAGSRRLSHLQIDDSSTPQRIEVVITDIDEWKRTLEYYPLPPAATKTACTGNSQEQQDCPDKECNNNSGSLFHLHYCSRRGFHPCDGSTHCSLSNCDQSQQCQQQQAQSSSLPVINICPSLCQRYLYHCHEK